MNISGAATTKCYNKTNKYVVNLMAGLMIYENNVTMMEATEHRACKEM